jgi:hypothetical protein
MKTKSTIKKEHIRFNWTDMASVKKAERKKARLENAGYTLKGTFSSGNECSITYELKYAPRSGVKVMRKGNMIQ